MAKWQLACGMWHVDGGMWHVDDGGMWHAAYTACDMGHRTIKCAVSTFTRARLFT